MEAPIQGLLVLAFLLFGGEDISAGGTTVAVLLVVASACTVGVASHQLRQSV